MNESTLNDETIIVENSTGSAIAGAVTYDSATRTVTFDPTANLEYNETYNVTITMGVADLAGNNMASNHTWNFTTSAPPSTTVAIADVKAGPGESVTVPIMVNYVTNLSSGEINVSFNQSVVHVAEVTAGDMSIGAYNINNAAGWVYVNAYSVQGKSGDVIFANLNLTAVGYETEVSPLNITVVDDLLIDTGYNYIPYKLSNGSFTVKDVTPPTYNWIEKPTNGTTGEDFLVSVFVTDNVGITNHTITVDGTDYPMTKNGDYYNYTIHVPWNSTADIIYNCTFKDAEGNSNTTGDITMHVTDNDKPTIINVTGDTSATTGENASITATFADNIGVTYAKIFWRQIGESSWESDSISNNTVYNITADDDAVGNISYYVVVNDTAGNGPVGDPSTDGSVVYNITVTDNDAPTIIAAVLSRDTILNDNGRPRKLGTNVSVLSVNVTDNVRNQPNWITSCVVDLSELGLATDANLTHESGDYGLWNGSIAIKETEETGVNRTNTLTINVTDGEGNFNTSTVYLTVLRRGDVYRDNAVNIMDTQYIARYRAHLEPEWSNPPTVLVGDVVGVAGDPTGDGKVNIMDALYIAKYRANLEDEP
ncbi:hypothetical protein CW714_08455 [Methanophagales archaeon]|nr:MAG: hypothetical protein CW714_08455 [Methanophagales archaeon]